MTVKNALALVILDGWGISENKDGNAIFMADKPNMQELMEKYPQTVIKTSGRDVGLPAGQMGNSEVGHLNMGAGRVVYQEFTRISQAIENGDFFKNHVLLEAVECVKERDSRLHLMGLLSDGGVHSHIEHLFALLELARKKELEKVFIHAFLDGRDVPPANAKDYIAVLEEKCRKIKTGSVATVMGRYYAMDRDKRWERTQKAYEAMVYGVGLKAGSAVGAVEAAYERGETDEFVIPTVIERDGSPVARIAEGDAVIFYNFRPDRARQITRAFVDEDFTGFDRGNNPPTVHFVCMAQYDKTIDAPAAFKPQRLVNTLGEVLSKHKLKQLRLAETEKYAHVTFFFNGGVEKPNPGEDRILVPSPKVSTYDKKPEMSAREVTEVFLNKLAEDKYDVFIVNYANPDMVGHTGSMSAAVRAVEAVDECVGRVTRALLERKGTVIITADHGNAEEMLDEEGKTHTAHTSNVVPFVLVSDALRGAELRPGRLEDVAPTVLEILGIPKPPEMTGKSLIADVKRHNYMQGLVYKKDALELFTERK